jgi:hypothetical protein
MCREMQPISKNIPTVRPKSPAKKYCIGLGLGLLGLVFTGALALRPARKPLPPEGTPTTQADANLTGDAKLFDALKRDALAPKFNLQETDEQNKPAALPHNLQELLAQMKDSPVPTRPIGQMAISLKKFICPDDVGFNGDVGVYDHGNLVGYLNIGRNFDSSGTSSDWSSDWLNFSLYRSIVDERGERSGYQQVESYMNSDADFVSLGGKISAAKLSQGTADNIYGPESLLPFGRYNKETGQLTDTAGNALGGLNRDERYLKLSARPSCLDETFEGAGFIEFTSLHEFDLFKGRMGKSEVWKQE